MSNGHKLIIDEDLQRLLDSNQILRKEDKENVESVIGQVEKFYELEVPSDKDAREKLHVDYVQSIEEFGKTLGTILFSFQLTKDEYLFLKDTILKKLEYNREEVFIALLVRDDFFYKYDTETSTIKTSIKMDKLKVGEVEKLVTSLPININDLTRISHLLGKYIAKDIVSKKTDNFASCIRKIGDISKIFNYYKMQGEKLQEVGNNWMSGFDKYDEQELEQELEEANSAEVVEVEKVK